MAEKRKARKASPCSCLRCKTRKNPNDCESKTCERWKSWFIRRWDYARELCRPYIAEEDGSA